MICRYSKTMSAQFVYLISAIIRTSLCKNQTSWKMKIFNPLQILLAVRRSRGMHRNVEKSHTNRLFISVQFRSFLLSGKQGKRLSEFLQKYTDSGTETAHLAGYNILVFKYVKISAGLPLLFIGAIREKSSKSDIA